MDTIAKQPVSNATLTLLKRKDSALVSFTMSNAKGQFEITGIGNGDYRLLITHINYHNKTVDFTISNGNRDLGSIIMFDKSTTLKEVVVNAEAPPVTLIGDTVQYNAGSFKTQPNANVEDLLKKLPGVKVDKDGNVKAQGEKVQKVLVDGKEFFGNDPKIATKNLPADAIDKVQVYDKLSDQAQLTGFDDGNSEKTINLKLKKDRKKGYFGKISAGTGDDGRYQGRLNVNSFKGARQMSMIGMGNNTNAEGFSFMDILNFTGAMNQLKNGGGNISINISDEDPIAGLLGANNTGINSTLGGGVNYNNIIGTKTDFQSNYFYSRYNPIRESHIQRQYFLPANVYNQNSYSNNINNNHRLNFIADYQIDSFHSIKISPSFNYQKTNNNTSSDYTTFSDQGKLTNNGNSTNQANNEGYNVSTSILFRKKFRRGGRTFSFNLIDNFGYNTGNGLLQSLTNFYDAAGNLLQHSPINQQNNNESSLGGYNARAVYTEPIFKKSLLEFSVGNSNTRNITSRTTNDFNASSGKFDLINNLFSNHFENVYGYTNAGIRLRKKTKSYNYAIGAQWQHATLEGKLSASVKDTALTKGFFNILPNARFQYYFSQFKNLLVSYTTNTNQPSITQLQPLPDNSNPLYIKIGNPNLQQEFTHVFRLNVSLVNPFKNRNIFAFFTFQETQNKIVNTDHINSLGVDSVMQVNTNGVYSMNGNLSWGFPVHFVKGSLELSSSITDYRGKQFINGQTNNIQTLTLGPEIRLESNPSDKLNVSVSAGLNYSNSTYSLQPQLKANYFTQIYTGDIGWQLPGRFYFATDFVYRINSQLASGFNAKVPLWKASISKQMLRFNRGELKFSVNDILNENIGISRSSNQNYVEDSRVNNLKRFFLLSFTYNLTKTGLNNAGGGGMRIITR